MCCGQRNVWRNSGLIAISLLAWSACSLHSTLLAAAEVVDLDLSHKQGVYQLRLEMILEAPPEDVRHVIADYVHIYRLNPSIVESEILQSSDKSIVRVRTLINACVLIFCREILRVEEVRELDTGDIYAEIDPRLSNVKSGSAIWQIQPLGDYTRISYDLILEPGFFVPPLIGTHLVKRKLHKETLTSFNNIERIAQIRNGIGAEDNPVAQRSPPATTVREHDHAN